MMGGVYRNQLKKYDRASDIVCGLVNQRVLLEEYRNLLSAAYQNTGKCAWFLIMDQVLG